MEARFGADFSGVRLHADTAARASAAVVGARAYTSGDHVVLGSSTADGPTLVHELDHVIQQREGPVSGVDDGSGLVVSDPSDRFERAAEATARHAVRGTLPRPGHDAADGRLLQANRLAPPGASIGPPPVSAVRTSTPAPGKAALRGGQSLRGGPAHAAVDAPLPIQRLTVSGREVDIASLSTRQAEEYSEHLHRASKPVDVAFTRDDPAALAEALSIKGRIDALEHQIHGSTPRIVVEDTTLPHVRRANTRPSETAVEIPTKPHPEAAVKGGRLNIWSGGGEERATASSGHTLGLTEGHHAAAAMMEAAYKRIAPNLAYERDPSYAVEVTRWLDERITDQDLTTTKPSAMTLADYRGELTEFGSLKSRYWLLRYPDGEDYVGKKLVALSRLAGQEAGRAPASEVAAGTGKPVGEFDAPTTGTSEVSNQPSAAGQVELVGFHGATFSSVWELVSHQLVVDAVRSFTPIASHGILSHPDPTKTIQHRVEIPAIQKEAKLQKDEIGRLIEMLVAYNGSARDGRVSAATFFLRKGIDAYVSGAGKLTINPDLPKAGKLGVSPRRLVEELRRKQSVPLMSQGSSFIRLALGMLKESRSYKDEFKPAAPRRKGAG